MLDISSNEELVSSNDAACSLAPSATLWLAADKLRGNLDASDADRKITRQLKDAAAIMDIPLLDHLIITQGGFFSFADEGLL